MSSELDYNIKQPVKLTAKSKTIIMLHGYGSNKEDLFSFSDYMIPDDLLISVHSPNKMDYVSYCFCPINLDDSINFTIDFSPATYSI